MSPISTTTSEAVGGSALIEMGLTVALATVRGPISCTRRSDERPDRATLDVSLYSAPFAPSGDRRVVNANTDRRSLELANQLTKALEATVHLKLYPKSRIQIGVVILADDGGRLPAAINAASLALIDAGIPVKDILCACSAGFAGSGGAGGGSDMTHVDLNRQEESSYGGQNAVCLPCAMLPQRGTIVLAQAEARLPDFDTLDRVLEAAMDGCRAIFEVMQAAIRERATLLLGMRSGQHGTKVVSSMDQNDSMDEG
jgi:exosome complex component RRP41